MIIAKLGIVYYFLVNILALNMKGPLFCYLQDSSIDLRPK